jgi:hypothetical protein
MSVASANQGSLTSGRLALANQSVLAPHLAAPRGSYRATRTAISFPGQAGRISATMVAERGHTKVEFWTELQPYRRRSGADGGIRFVCNNLINGCPPPKV